MRSSPQTARSRAAFTLLEVLAAIALLGVVFTALSRSAAVGVLSEGHSRRLFEASLLADTQLAELQLAALAGEVPEIGVTESEVDDFVISVEALAWSLPKWLQEERDAVISTPSPVFGDGTEQNQSAIREIRLTIAWSDGVNQRSIERVTYALDRGAVAGSEALEGASLLDLNQAVRDALEGSRR
jgi:prepilin-type N-terminal cleavage/methylation domain-containing protein